MFAKIYAEDSGETLASFPNANDFGKYIFLHCVDIQNIFVLIRGVRKLYIILYNIGVFEMCVCADYKYNVYYVFLNGNPCILSLHCESFM